MKAQHRIDPIFDSPDEQRRYAYGQAREELFPQSRKGSVRNANRAGDKLDELFTASQMKDIISERYLNFIDACAAPGSWSLYLLRENKTSAGIGMSMPISGTPLEKTWYPQLSDNPRFTQTFGADNSGNIYFKSNIDALVEEKARLLKNR